MDTLFEELDTLVPAVMAEYGVPGIGIAIIRDGQVAYARGFGERRAVPRRLRTEEQSDAAGRARRQGQPGAVDEQTIFGIGSCTKAFTALSAGLLVQAGKLRWDDRVTEYLPGFQLYDPVDTREITVRDLLCHRAGLPTFGGDFMGYGSRYTDAEALARVRYIPPAFRLRAGYGYANLMYAAAGQVIEVVSGLKWAEFVRQHLLEPLGMNRTFTDASGLESVENVAQPHQLYNGQLTELAYSVFHNGAAAGAMVSSAADMAAWLRFQLAGGRVGDVQLVEEAILEETRTPQVLIPLGADVKRLVPRRHFQAYGLGWFLEDYGGRLVMIHTGGVDGMQSLVAALPEEQFGLVILSNRIPHYANGTLYRLILDRQLGFHDRDWRAVWLEERRKEEAQAAEKRKKLDEQRPQGTQPSLPLVAYAGTYANSIYGTVEVAADQGRLTIHLGAHPNAAGPLEHLHTDTFFCRWSYSTLEESLVPFNIGMDGRVESLKIKVADFVDPLVYEFRRVEEK